MGDTDDLLLREGARLLHIGPHKTGSTALQSAMDRSRDELAAHGALYAGRRRHESEAIRWVTGRTMAHQDPRNGRRRWRALVRQIGDAGEKRVALSSEYFSDADDDSIARVVEDVGRDRVHVVVTLRPLAKILPSQWQQYVQRGLRTGYEGWLAAMFDKAPYEQPTPSFWRRHRHDRLVRRWAAAVGPQNLTVVVLDPADRAFLPHTIERMLGVPEDILQMEDETANRSLTWAEVEIMRQFNRQYSRNGLPASLHTKMMRSETGAYLKRREPGRDEARIRTPPWALERAAEVGTQMAEDIADSGVRVVGDLAVLATGTGQAGSEPADPDRGAPTVPTDVAARLAAGVALVLARYDRRIGDLQGRLDQRHEQMVDEVPGRVLARALARRVRARLRPAARESSTHG